MNSKEKFKVIIDKHVAKYIKKLEIKQKQRIISLLGEMSVNPFIGDIETIKGKPGYYRRRIGFLRLKFLVAIKEKEVHILDLGPRSDFKY